jgi:peptidylprolyl isomerase/FKBP-type peptidyl-prolyl cis-trans isomerase FklB
MAIPQIHCLIGGRSCASKVGKEEETHMSRDFPSPFDAIRKALLTLGLVGALSACTSAPSVPETPAGPDFLAQNAAAKGVVTTPSGLQYQIVRSGPAAGRKPMQGDTVTFDYEGKLLTGETFDSSYQRGEPISGEVGAFVPGFDEALMMMRPGDEWIVWIPPELGYGSTASGPIPANSVLRFRMELREVRAASRGS